MTRRLFTVLLALGLTAAACGGTEARCAGDGCSADSSSRCYAPTQNLDRAYDDGWTGCACSEDDDLCLADSTGRLVALICNDGRWAAAQDGPCATVEAQRCFGPERNLDAAYEPSAIGCDCVARTSVCASDSTGRQVALICVDNRWTAVEDGPCA